MPAGSFLNLGRLSNNDLTAIPDGYGYAFGSYDGSNIYGPVFQISGYTDSKLQIKANHIGDILKFRTKKADGDMSWSAWRKILTE